MRTATGILLALCLVLGLFFALRVERSGRRSSGVPRLAGDPELALAGPERAEPPSASVGPVAEDERAAVETPAEQDAEGRDLPSMRVLVRDAVDGRPLAGALVTYFDRATPIPRRTGDDGSCVLPLLSHERPARLLVQAEGHVHAYSLSEPEPKLFVDLLRSTRMEGRVLAADTGEAVTGATLTLRQTHDGCEDERASSADDGRYELPSVPLWSEAVLEVRAEGFATSRRTFELRSDARRTLQDIHLVRGIEIEGRVEDWISGNAIAGARAGELETDAGGNFRGLVLTRGPQAWTTFRIEAAGHASLDVVLALEPAPKLVFRLPRPAFLEGRVTDTQGQPLSDASVSFRADGPIRGEDVLVEETSPLYELPEGWSYSLDERPAKSDADGRYRLPVMPWSLNGTARASARGAGTEPARLKSIGAPDSVQRLDWWMKADPRTTISGEFTLNGQGCGGFQGTVSWRGPMRSGSPHFALGRYELEVEPGEHALSAVLDLAPHLPSPEVTVQVAQGARQHLALDIEAPIVSITGSVEFEFGTPVAGHEVLARFPVASLFSSCWLTYRTLTDARGEYELLVPDAGLNFDVSVRDFWGRETLKERIVPGAYGVDFELHQAYRFFVRAREALSGAALVPGEDVQLLARWPRYGYFPLDLQPSPDAAGWYESWITEREIDLLALPQDALLPHHGAALLHGVRVAGSEPARIELVLELGRDVVLELAEGSEPWPADHELLLVAEELQQSVRRNGQYSTPFDELAERCTVRFDGEGRAQLHGLAPGSYRMKATPPDLLIDPEFVRVDQGTLPVLVRWSRRE